MACLLATDFLCATEPRNTTTLPPRNFVPIFNLPDKISSFKLNTYSHFKRLFLATAAPATTYAKHYIAPAPWQYWSKANQIVITTESTTTVTGTINKSDGTLLFNFTCVAGSPYVNRFPGLPSSLAVHPLKTVISGAGLIVTADASISVNLRNIASDDLGSDGNDANIKGNASLFSFGDAGVGTAFRVGYYRDGDLAGSERPTYSIMAIENNTIIKIAGSAVATLNAGQSYLFQQAMGTLVESSGPAVMNTSARLDAPGGCGDGAYNPIPPISSLGSEYVIVRGEGNLVAEQTTIIATEPNTKVHIEFFDENGIQRTFQDVTIASAGGFSTFNHGWILNNAYNSANNTGRFSSSRIVSDKNILVFSGTGGVSSGGGCEVDIATLVPIAQCAGSRKVETYKFTSYKDVSGNTNLPYFGYIITKNSDKIYLTTKGGSVIHNGTDIESISGIGPRKPLGSSGLYLIKFTDANIGRPAVLSINSASRLTVSMVQQSSEFSMSNFISRFPEKSLQPSVEFIECSSAKLTADPSSKGPYRWYLNGVEIAGATLNVYTATTSGNYTVSSQLECGLSAQSLPLIISLCNIDRAILKTVDVALPEKDQIVVFTLKAQNLGTGDAIGVSVNDLLPLGYSYVSSTANVGSYNAVTGVWSIGSMVSGSEATLLIRAKVIVEGTHVNSASISGPQNDSNSANDNSSASTSTLLGQITLVSLGPPDRNVCINNPIENIVYEIGGGASGAVVTGLPNGISYIYDPTTKKLTISGNSTVASPPEGFAYKVTTTGGIPVSKTAVIIVKDYVVKPIFTTGLTTSRCVGLGSSTYNATATNSDAIIYSLSPSAAGSIDPLTGVVTWAGEFVGDAVVTAKALGCNEQVNNLPITVYSKPLPLISQDLTFCQNQEANSLSTIYSETQLTWYNSNGTEISGDYKPQTVVVGATEFYVSKKNLNNCESEKVKVTIIVTALPNSPDVEDINYCQGQQDIPALTASGAPGATFTWYDASGNVLSGAPTPSVAQAGEQTYFVTQRIGVGCESERSALKVTVRALPSAPVSAGLVYCQGQQDIPALTASGAPGATFTWYDASGNVLSGAPTPSAAQAGEQTYFVTQRIGVGCESERSALKVTVRALPSAPVSAGLVYCQGQQDIPALTASGAPGATFTWYDASGNVLSGAPTPSVAQAGEQTYFVTQRIGVGCESEKSALKVTVRALPSAPVSAGLVYCQGQQDIPALTASGAPGATFTWYDASGNVLSGAPTPSAAQAGEQTYFVTQRIGVGCESERSALKVTVRALPSAPVSAGLVYCQGQQDIPALTASGAPGATFTWYDASGNVLSGAPTPSAAQAGEQTYFVTQRIGVGCESERSALKVTVRALPSAPVSAGLVYCQGQQDIPALTASGAPGATFTWYDASGNVLSGAPTPSAAQAGEQTYFVTQRIGVGCESERSALKVTVRALPSAPVSAGLVYCQGQQDIPALTASGAPGATFTWYDASGNVLSGAPTPSAAQAGEQTYFVTQRIGVGCESERSALKVTVRALPSAPVSAGLVYCQGQQDIPALTASGAPGATFTWYDASGNVLSGAPTPSAAQAGEQTYFVTQRIGVGCESEKSALKVTVRALPSAPVSAGLVYCQGQQDIPALTASGAPGATFTWYDASGNVLSGAPTPSVAQAGEQTYFVTQRIGVGCESEKSALKVTVRALPSAPVSAGLVYCQGQQDIPALTASGAPGATFTWYDASGNVLSGAPTPSAAQAGEQTYFVTQRIGVGCESERSALKVTVRALPSAPVSAGLVYCQGQQDIPALTASGAPGATFTWYDASGNVLSGAPTPSAAQAGEQTYFVTQRIGVGCESERSALKVTVRALPSAPVSAGLVYCQGQQDIPALTASGAPGATFTWYDASGNVLSGAPTPSVAQAGEQTYFVTQRIGVGCESEKSALKVTVRALPSAPVSAGLVYCQGQQDIPALTASGAPGATFTWYDASGNVLSGAPTPSAAQAGEQTYFVTQRIGVGCESERSALKVTVRALPSAPVSAGLVYCQGQQDIPALTASGAPGATFTWYDASGNVLSGAPTPSAAQAGEQTYFVTQRIGVGCESEKSALKVTVRALPSAPVSAGLVYCQGQQDIPALTASGAPGATFTWYDASGNVLSGAPTPSAAQAGEQTYFVTQRISVGCEGLRTKIVVIINNVPLAPRVRNSTYCQNEIPQALTAEGQNLRWYDEQGILLNSNPIPSTELPGLKKYYVTQSNASGCESPKAVLILTVFARPEKPIISASGPVKICEGGSVTLKSSSSDFYQWYKDGTVLTGENKQILNVAVSGLYSVRTSNSSGCYGDLSELVNVSVISISQKPVLTYQGKLNICEGSFVLLKSPSVDGNQWFRDDVLIEGATGQTFEAKLTGKYRVVVNNVLGCAGLPSDPAAVNVYNIEEAPVISTQSDLVICKGGNARLISSVSTGNQWYKNDIPIQGAVDMTYTATSSGKYTVKHRNFIGCESPSSNAINLSEQEFKISLDANSSIADYGSKIILNVGSNLRYKILSWSPSNLFQDIDAKSQAFILQKDLKITVNAISENGCPASATVEVLLKKKKDLFIPNTFTPNGDGRNDVFKVFGTNIEMVEWNIYSQWGELIHKSKQQDAIWDGTYRGVMQPVGVYLYKCVVRFKDGEEIVKNGAINLLR